MFEVSLGSQGSANLGGWQGFARLERNVSVNADAEPKTVWRLGLALQEDDQPGPRVSAKLMAAAWKEFSSTYFACERERQWDGDEPLSFSASRLDVPSHVPDPLVALAAFAFLAGGGTAGSPRANRTEQSQHGPRALKGGE